MKAWPFIIIFLILAPLACKSDQQKNVGEREAQLSRQVSIWIDSCWNQRSFNALQGLTSSESTRYMNGVKVAIGPAELEAHLRLFFTAFPDLVITAGDVHYKDNLAFIQWNAQGTNTGVFGEIRPTGKRININGLSHLNFSKEGKIIQEIVYYNELELLQQMGYSLIPPNLE
ncbi:ester cyclase [Lentiprolixibacter aurantiacus]|uniref:Ester cyclase n=1 Tax=Lentiprolixibacter aurantiacus TaxID=2993939 RepID=A0AAE3SQ94_9FLAO|nr:ester cyclase [Lentiprolixibacter aurantiacus]MCX2720287.1 ester cyclase [Lentiprolixibacter aurantiacus]